MSAQGKITAAAIAQAPAGTVRILITDDPQLRKPPSEQANRNSIWYPAANKRGMAVATVTSVGLAVQQRGAAKRRYDVITDRGTVESVSGSQTFWLAPDAAPSFGDGKPARDMTTDEMDATAKRAAAQVGEEPAPTGDELTREARVILGGLATSLTRAGEDVHAGNVERLARGGSDGTLSWEDVAHQVREMRAPQQIRSMLELAADELLRALITVEATPRPAEVDGYPLWLCHVRDDDVITLPGETGRRTVTSAWWISERQAHGLRFDDGTAQEIASEGAPRVRLHERPGFGPFGERYEVGDRVVIWTPVRGEQLGVVLEVTRYGDGVDEVAYEVGTVISGKVAVGSENMRREYTPAPQLGEVWTSVSGTQVVIESLDTYGLVGRGSGLVGGGAILGAPYWMPPSTVDKSAAELAPGDVVAGLRLPDGTVRDLVEDRRSDHVRVLREAKPQADGWHRLVFTTGLEVEFRSGERFPVVASTAPAPEPEPAAPFVSGWVAVGASA